MTFATVPGALRCKQDKYGLHVLLHSGSKKSPTQNTATPLAVSRKLLQMANLDASTMLAFLHDTFLLNSVLLDAGIDTPGDRLKIILTLKSMISSPLSPKALPPIASAMVGFPLTQTQVSHYVTGLHIDPFALLSYLHNRGPCLCVVA